MDFHPFNRKELGDKITLSITIGRAVALTGGIGVGKTFLARAAMDHIKCNAIEFDANFPIQEARIPKQAFSFGKSYGVLIEGMENAIADTYKMIKKHVFKDTSKNGDGLWYESRFPTIFCISSKSKFKFGEKYCDFIEVPPLSREDIIDVLSSINKKDFAPDILYVIADSCKGDIRKAINAMQIGRIEETGKYDKLSDMVKVFLGCDPEDRISVLADNKVGEYGGVGLEYLISLVSRNIKGSAAEVKSDMKILDNASRLKYVNAEAAKLMLCGLNQNRVRFLKWPKKKVDKNEPGHDNAKTNMAVEED